jgi:carbon storage regulator
MLVLTRRAGEKIVLTGGIEFVILAVNGSQVRVGVAAPPHVTIDREEIAEKKKNEAAYGS